MKELEKETQLQVTGGSVVFGAFCVLFAVALQRMLRQQRLNMSRLCGHSRY